MNATNMKCKGNLKQKKKEIKTNALKDPRKIGST